jgi:peroxiredoxin
MDEPDLGDRQGAHADPKAEGPRYGRYVGLLGIIVLVLITINTISTKPNGDTGVPPGRHAPPFAVPLALGDLPGDANVATANDLGAAGKVPACTVRGSRVLNMCQLYEQGPVVLALFVPGQSCPDVLSDMQSLLTSFPQVSFAAVAIKSTRTSVRRLVSKLHLTFPVGLDPDGALAALYELATCPQVSFIEKGGVIQSRALLNRPSIATLRGRVRALLAASRASGVSG